ncbi:aldose 1-epimerase family protein [Teichococcus vastitatis]|uniref:Aldose 1-epimerase family protein n=1 Tax=Teichococcus vastitatis TaxID=2307076 RepID=A0ABS9WBH1_9PROT|nr:aldose 1-epimerase family protein [Pseudoroseomonas vastitatis]MCI0756651.1 aldose 1-epimerase family protein [Pseudoroseomonas vastitatis]
MSEQHSITGGGLSATIKTGGAELCGLRGADGTEYLWNAGPEWPRFAPILFPIVGKLAGDTLRHAGRAYGMTQHGFARDRRFDWLSRGDDAVRLVLQDDAESRGGFPFAFRLEVEYAAGAAGLRCTVTVSNPGPGDLPFSLGAHPAFRWPLRPGLAKNAHRLTFEEAEPGPVHYLSGGLLGEGEPSPVRGRELTLAPGLFARDALIWRGLASRSVRYAAPGGPALTFSWEGYPDLGLWSKPDGADFLCIEPWQGTASPAGWDGEFASKPGVVVLPPAGSRAFIWRVALEPMSAERVAPAG